LNRSKPLHYRPENAAHPLCDGTGRTRRFKWTQDVKAVTCKRCIKQIATRPAQFPTKTHMTTEELIRTAVQSYETYLRAYIRRDGPLTELARENYTSAEMLIKATVGREVEQS
jgi:hypothetical protein